VLVVQNQCGLYWILSRKVFWKLWNKALTPEHILRIFVFCTRPVAIAITCSNVVLWNEDAYFAERARYLPVTPSGSSAVVLWCFSAVLLCYSALLLCYSTVLLCYSDVLLCYLAVLLCLAAWFWDCSHETRAAIKAWTSQKQNYFLYAVRGAAAMLYNPAFYLLSMAKVTELLEKEEYTEFNEPDMLMASRGTFYRLDAHCDDVILFPSDQKEALKCLDVVRKGYLVLQVQLWSALLQWWPSAQKNWVKCPWNWSRYSLQSAIVFLSSWVDFCVLPITTAVLF